MQHGKAANSPPKAQTLEENEKAQKVSSIVLTEWYEVHSEKLMFVVVMENLESAITTGTFIWGVR